MTLPLRGRKVLGTLLGVAVLVWLVLHIGVTAILETLAHCHLGVAGAVVLIQMLGLTLRYLKVRVYTPEYTAGDAAELFLMSRMGGELSAALYLTPLVKQDFRSTRVAGYVLLDRLLEVGSTLTLATLAALWQWHGHSFLRLALLLFTAQLLAIAALLAWPARLTPSFGQRLPRVSQSIAGVRAFLHGHRRNLPILCTLTLASTALDMVAVVIGFAAVGTHVDLGQVPIIWALGASVGALTFIGVGPAEVTWVYLFHWLFGVTEAATGGMIVVTRSAGVLALAAAILLAWLWRRTRKSVPSMGE